MTESGTLNRVEIGKVQMEGQGPGAESSPKQVKGSRKLQCMYREELIFGFIKL